MYPAYFPKHNSNREKQVILLMIPNEEKRKIKSEGQWHYLALLRGKTYKHHGDFYCLNCVHSFATEKNLNRIKKYMKIKIFVM